MYSFLAMSNEERALKSAGTLNNKSPIHQRRPPSSHEQVADPFDYSQIIDRTERMKKRWERVIENKERM